MNEVVSLPGSVTSGESLTLAETAYRKLRNDIIEGVHRPGTKLRVEHLKSDYDVGAGTLREALQLLLNDGLVVAQGHRGFTVAPMSAEDFQDITRTRVMIETEALRQAIALGDDQLRIGNDEQGRADHRQAETIAKDGRQSHGRSPWWIPVSTP